MIYLLHFATPFKHAKHYIGFVEYESGLDARLKKHAKGGGARLMEVISKAGIGFILARTWRDGDRNYERHLKNLKAATRLCPVCNPKAMDRASKVFTSTNNYTLSKEAALIESITCVGTMAAIHRDKLEGLEHRRSEDASGVGSTPARPTQQLLNVEQENS